ncbi:MAG: CmpA/NrtA family ABC transporter substrate-binding protein [Pseudomonadota bacterium]
MSKAGRLRLGFLALADAAPLIVAEAQGFFAEEGLDVVLEREAAWATVRDKLAAGALDGAQMLAPAVLAATLGLGAPATPLVAPLALNRGGAAVVLSPALAAAETAGALAAALEARRVGGAPAVFGVVFPYSLHDCLLRHWLAARGIDPDRDARLIVAPPSRTAGLLAAGELDGFSAGEPWGAVAVARGLGAVAARATTVFPGAPDKVLAVREEMASRDPGRLRALLRALLRAGRWCDEPDHREALAELLSAESRLAVPAAAIRAGLADIVFHAGEAGAPAPVEAAWLLAQMLRWGQAPGVDIAATVKRTWRHDLYAAAAGDLGWPVRPPASSLALGEAAPFRLSEARAWAAAQPFSRL